MPTIFKPSCYFGCFEDINVGSPMTRQVELCMFVLFREQIHEPARARSAGPGLLKMPRH